MAKKESRRSVMVNGVAPGGTMKLHEVPDRADYIYGDEGTASYEADMLEFMAGNIDDDGVEARTLDWRELKVGLFADTGLRRAGTRSAWSGWRRRMAGVCSR